MITPRLTLAVLSAAVLAHAASLRPIALRCEYRANPMGIDTPKPRLSWELESIDPKAHDLRQTAYRILATDGSTPLWDSGRIESAQSIHVEYAGPILQSGQRVDWKVQVWDQSGAASAWSQTAHWSMGLLNASDWKGRWIGREEASFYRDPESPFRDLSEAHWIWIGGAEADLSTTFVLPANRPVLRAFAVFAGDSSFSAMINGAPAGRGSAVILPELLDVAQLLKAGENRIEVHAKQGKAAKAGFLGSLRIEFATGEPIVIRTSKAWNEGKAEDRGAYGSEPWGEVGYSEERALPARMLRKEFAVTRKPVRATAYLCGLGLSVLRINGQKISEDVLSPGLTDYDHRAQYVTYDVTAAIHNGSNAVGIELGNGRYWAPRDKIPIPSRSFGYPKTIAQIEIEFSDGTRQTEATDESWKLSANGPIRANNEYDGEFYDATRETPGWDRPGFESNAWQAAQVVAPPAGRLVAQMAEPLRVIETILPVAITSPRAGVFIFDFGQNMVGWCRLHVSGSRGQRVVLRHAETLKPDGTLYVDNLRSARAADTYILRGGALEVWEPQFTYHGFRYVEVTGYPGKPALTALEGRVVHDAMTQTADFTSSSDLLNRLHKNIFWGVRGNYRSIPTDCPQRDERQGWLGDRSVVSRSESYLFDIAALYSKWMTDLADSQNEAGTIPDVAPNYWRIYTDDVTWPSTFLLVPQMLYEQYGDRRVIERQYPAMQRWIKHMQGFLKDDLLAKDTFGDWCVPPESPKLIHSEDPARRTSGTLLGSAYFIQLLRLMSGYADLLGKTEDKAAYEALASRMTAAFQKKFYKTDDALFDNGTQTSSVLPLAFGLVPPEDRDRTFARLTRRIADETQGHLGVGLVGAQWLMRTLSDNGRADLAFQIASQKTYPGWGYMIEKGATTVWELWNGDTADPAMNSGNHVMQVGDLAVWMYEYLAGIRAAEPGFRKIEIRPYTIDGLQFVKASHRSMYGLVRSEWRREGGKIGLKVTIPPNTTAVVYVPGSKEPRIVGSGTWEF